MTVVSADLLFPSPPLRANKAPPYPECASTVQPQASTGTNSLHSVTGNKRWWTLTHIHGHKRYAIDMQGTHIPLDVGYVDGYGLLVTLVKNTICAHKSVIVIVYSTSYWFV